jgi:hypothetical protein
MKHLILIWLACVALAYTALAAPPPYRDLPGWRKQNWCAPFAEAFEKRCNEAGTPAVRLTYDWGLADGRHGRHVVVLFKDAGQLWLMDNEHLKPWGPAKGASDLEILKRHVNTPVVNMVNNEALSPAAARALANLFPNP